MKSKIRVVHIIGGFRFGGIERLVFDLASVQKQNINLLPEILVLNSNGEFKERFLSLGINIVSVNLKSTYRINLKKIKKINNCFKNVDIIHFHGFHLYIAILAIFSNKKIIYTEHGNFAFGRKKKVGDYFSHFLRRYFYKYFVDEVACNSNFTKSYLNNVWGLKQQNIICIHNGSNYQREVNQQRIKSIKLQFNNHFLIGTTSRLAGFKKVDRLIKSFEIFSKKKQNVSLIIVGEGPERGELEKLVINNSIYNVIFIGYKPNVSDYQSAFDVCVAPSINEPFGLVAVESYLVGTPVVVFRDGGGLTEIVSECCPEDIVDDIEGLVERLEYYYRNRNIKIDTAKIKNKFSIDRMERDYLKHYKNLLCVE